MITYTKQNLTIHFGTQKEGFPCRSLQTIQTQQELLTQPPFAHLKLTHLITLNQTHSTQGYVFNKEQAQTYAPYSLEGDYLITNTSAIALGVATADCLPLILYDPAKNVVGIAHAGWQGTAGNIVPKMLAHILQEFNNDLADILVFLGPAGRSCCYEVQQDFLQKFASTQAVTTRAQKIYFDVSTYNYELLIHAGIPAQNINREYNTCTICDPTFCSYRRDGIHALRQMTIVSL